MHKPLLFVTAFLTSAVVGCDDPEVTEKVADVLMYGAATAEVQCIHSTSLVNSYVQRPGIDVYFKAISLLDGSCYVTACSVSKNNQEDSFPNTSCRHGWVPKDPNGEDKCHFVYDYEVMSNSPAYPHRQGLDGIHFYLSDGFLTVDFRDNWMNKPGANCGTSQYPVSCTYPYPWFSLDLTDPECSGRNLENFGVE